MPTAPADADLDAYIAAHQGETIDVPGETYALSGPIRATGATHIRFHGTRLRPPTGYQQVFVTSGQGWRLGGDCTVDMNERGFYTTSLAGQGQLGDSTGRIEVEGHANPDHIPRKGGGRNWVFRLDGGAGTIRIQNVTYLGHTPGAVEDLYATWTSRPGDIELIGCHFENFNHGFYLKAHRGKVTAKDCYIRDVSNSFLRIGSDKGALVERCVYVGTAQRHGSYTAGRPGVTNHSFLAFEDTNANTGPVEVRGCHYVRAGQPGAFFRRLEQSPEHNDYSIQATVADCAWPAGEFGTTKGFALSRSGNTTDPVDFGGPYLGDVTTPDPDPEPEPQPDEPDPDEPDRAHTLTVASADQGERTDYTLEVTGGVAKSTARGASIDAEDEVAVDEAGGYTRITGTVAGGLDSYAYDGRVTLFEFDGATPQVFVDGAAVALDAWPDPVDEPEEPDPEPDPEEPDEPSVPVYPRRVVLERAGDRGAARYTLTVSGAVAPDADLGDMNPADSIQPLPGGRTRIEGRVIGGVDAYTFGGDVVGFEANGPLAARFEATGAEGE